MASLKKTIALSLAITAYAVLAEAHGGIDDYQIRPVAERTSISGITVQAIQSNAPQLVIENKSGKLLEILDDEGRAFLRIGPDGVEGDMNASAFYNTYSTAGLQPPQNAQDPAAMPDWKLLSEDQNWGWFDPRIAETAFTPSHTEVDEAKTNGQPITVASWSVPVRFAGEPNSLDGRFELSSGPATIATASITSSSIDGWSTRIVPGANPAILLKQSKEESEGQVVTILGEQNEPYIRLSSQGVSVNVESDTWRQYGRANGDFSGISVNEDTDPEWMNVSTSSAYTFMHPSLFNLQRSPENSPIGWHIAVDVDGQKGKIEGETSFQTPAN